MILASGLSQEWGRGLPSADSLPLCVGRHPSWPVEGEGSSCRTGVWQGAGQLGQRDMELLQRAGPCSATMGGRAWSRCQPLIHLEKRRPQGLSGEHQGAVLGAG